MISNIDKQMIKLMYKNIIENYEFPKFGSPETKCEKCMFFKVACIPPPQYVGCLGGWKMEEEER